MQAFQSCLIKWDAPANTPKKGDEPNPPQWPHDKDNAVVIVKESITESEIQELQQTYQDTYDTEKQTFRPHDDHFSDRRTAILFERGSYKFDLQVGYYVQVAGLGGSASDVVFEGTDYGPYCPAYNLDHEIQAVDPQGNSYTVRGTSLDTFWRATENFTNRTNRGLLWAVSQAAPIRRVHAEGSLSLFDEAAYSSGGHMANCLVDGALKFGTQQQFCCRSVTMVNKDQVSTGAWSNVFVDCINVPPVSDGSQGAAVTVHTPTITVEKPYIVKEGDKYSLRVPKPRIHSNESEPLGADLDGKDDETRSFENVYVAWAKLADNAEVDTNVASKINKALDQGKDVVLSPGIYHLEGPIKLKRSNQVLLGIGLATLVAPKDGSPCIQVASKVEGVRVAGIMFEASKIPDDRTKVACFIEWGVKGTPNINAGNPLNPGVLSDIFCRVGGSSLDRTVAIDVMVRIHSNHVLGDNLWLWRADHVQLGDHELPNFPPLEYHQTVEGEVPVKTGLEVNGNNVTVHGLAVEHTTEHQVVWRGEHGQVYFYQCEFPYDVSSDFGVKNYLGYCVDRKVEIHSLGGAGIYSNFRDQDVLVKSAIQHPKIFDMNSSQVVNPFTKHLNNKGLIMTVVTDGRQNGGGPAVAEGPPARFPALPSTD